MTDGSAAWDICSDEDTVIPTEARRLVSTGLAMELTGYAGILTHRSGHNAKDGLIAYGTIDSDYRGEVKVVLYNFGLEPFYIKKGDRIAQLRLTEHCTATFIETEELNGTARGNGGFGSTGVKAQ